MRRIGRIRIWQGLRFARLISLIGLIGLVGLAGLATLSARAQGLAGADDTLLTSDEMIYEERLGIVTARGSVELTRGDRVLRADTISYNRNADVVTASGNIALLEPSGEVLFADYLELAGDLKSGAIAGIRVLLTDDSRLAANGARMAADGRTDMSKAVYSPCEICTDGGGHAPFWQVKAVRVTHDKALQRIFYTDAIFEVFGVPVAYLPFFSHPDPTVVRKTGFLDPVFGSDTTLGITYQQPFFFDISPSQDATIAPIITSKEGVILTGEYRQVTESGLFNVQGSVTRDERRIDDPKTTRRTRGHILGEGAFALDGAWTWGFDVGRATDATYLGRFGFGRGQDSLTSELYLENALGRDFTQFRALSFQSLDPNVDEATVPYIAPLVDYKVKSEPGSDGSYWLFDANAMVLGRDEGAESRRLSLKGGWRLPFTGPGGDFYEFTLAMRADGYSVEEVARGGGKPTFDGFTGRLVPSAELFWRYPFARSIPNGLLIVEPLAQLIVSPNGGNPAEIPNEDSLVFEFDDANLFSVNRFPGLDRVEGGGRANYGVRLYAQGLGGGYSELLIGQTYRLQADDTFETGTGLDDNFSDYVGRITVAPADYLDFSYRFRLDKDNFTARRSQVSVSAGTRRLRGWLDYTNLSDEPTTGSPTTVEQINLFANLRITDNWSVNARHQRDLSANGGSLFTGFGVTYENECIQIVTRLDRNFTQDFDIEASTTFTFQVRLRNLG